MRLLKPCLIKVTQEEFELVNLKEVGRVVCDVVVWTIPLLAGEYHQRGTKRLGQGSSQCILEGRSASVCFERGDGALSPQEAIAWPSILGNYHPVSNFFCREAAALFHRGTGV